MTAAERIKHWREHPVDFVRELFKVEPDVWQADVLEAFADQRPEAWRIAMAASAGPGKTATLAWCGLNFLLCYGSRGNHPKGAAIAVTEDNLRDNLWPELSKWMQRTPIFRERFKWTKSRVFAVDHPETWFLSARTFSKTADPEEQGRTLSGLHSDFLLYLIDESGDIPPAVLRSAEQGLGSCKFGKILQAGNTTSLDGMLYHAVATQRERWRVIRITGDPEDPKRSQRVDIEWAKQQIADYGRDNPWVMAYVLGKFPPNSLEGLIDVEVVEQAMRRKMRPEVYDWAQKRLGIDVARTGGDRTIIFPRQGLMTWLPVTMRHRALDKVSVDIADRVIAAKLKWGSERELFDDTVGWAHGAIDVFRAAGYESAVGIDFGSKKVSDPRYANRRSEMWMRMADWLKNGGSLPYIPELVKELTAPTFGYQGGKFLLEPKKLIKKRLGYSPDCFVAGTMVSTPDGLRSIESLRCEDLVSTPFGEAKIIATHESEPVDVVRVDFSDGRSLVGKGKHKVFTWEEGWKRLDALTLSNTIELDNQSRRRLWKFLSLWITKGKGFISKQQVGIIALDAKAVSACCIAGFILNTLEIFQRICASTIRTMIGLITGQKTFALNSNLSMQDGTLTIDGRSQTRRGCFSMDSKELQEKQRNGMEVKKEKNGTQSIVLKDGGIENLKKAGNVNIAENRSKHIFQEEQCFVPLNASVMRVIVNIRQQLENVFCVAKNLFITNIVNKNAVRASAPIDTGKLRTYNITLDKYNVYFANGILVDNCADGLALTFAEPEVPRDERVDVVMTGIGHRHTGIMADYDPYDKKNM